MTTIPTIAQLEAAILADLQSVYGSTIPTFGKNFLRAMAKVQAAKLKMYYLAIADLQKNLFADTADPEALGGTLERFGRIKLGRNPFPAQAGQYIVTVTGTIGASIPASTTFKSNDSSVSPGMLFILDATHVMATGSDLVQLRALTPGTASKLAISDQLTSTAPIANVTSIVTVSSEATQPLDAETIDAYRAATLNAYRDEPQGGAASDYRLWSQDAQGVANTYPYAKSGASGEINLYVESDIIDSIDGRGTPSAAMLSAVQAVVEFDPDTTKPLTSRGRRPLGVFQVHYLPVTPLVVTIQISSFSGITSAIQASILSAITTALSTVRPFVAGADILADKNDTFGQNEIISNILSVVPGSIFGSVVMTVGGSVQTSHTYQNGDIPYLSSITYI